MTATNAIRAKAQADWSARAAEIYDPATIAGIQIGYDRAISVIENAVADERERCASIAEDVQATADCPEECERIAETIRGTTK
jgi:hypothetical protein